MSVKSEIPPEFLEYVKNPLPEDLTAELFEDLHYVLDPYIVEVARERKSVASDQEIICDWESAHKGLVNERRASIQQRFGALLPYAFISSNVKFEFLIQSGVPAFQDRSMPEDVAEVMQEFVELLIYRDELVDKAPSGNS